MALFLKMCAEYGVRPYHWSPEPKLALATKGREGTRGHGDTGAMERNRWPRTLVH